MTAAGLGAAGCSDAPAEREAEAADILLLERAEPWCPEPFGLAGEEKRQPGPIEELRGSEVGGGSAGSEVTEDATLGGARAVGGRR